MGNLPKKEEKVGQGEGANLIYQMGVTVKGVRPLIWRRIQVTVCTKLGALHGILQAVMGWSDRHLHEFNIHGIPYGDASQSPAENVIDENTVNLSQLISGEKQRFLYVYDLTDNWEHEILVERILPIDEGMQYPVCLNGRRSCPPEDCGGPRRYAKLLETIRSPSHPQYEETWDQVGENFDPERFDIKSINARLQEFQR